MTSYLIIIHNTSLIFTIMQIKPRLLIHIQTIMQIRPDPWPPKWPLTPMNIHGFIDRLRHTHCLKINKNGPLQFPKWPLSPMNIHRFIDRLRNTHCLKNQ